MCVRAVGAANSSTATTLVQRAVTVTKERRTTVKTCYSGRKRVEAKRKTMDRSSTDTGVHHSPILRPSTFPASCLLLMISFFLDWCSPPCDSAESEQSSLFTFTKGARLEEGWQADKAPASLLQAAKETEGGYCCTQKAPALHQPVQAK